MKILSKEAIKKGFKLSILDNGMLELSSIDDITGKETIYSYLK